MINHREGNEIDVHASGPNGAANDNITRSDGNPFSIDQNQGFFRQQTPQVRSDSAVAALVSVLTAGRAHLLWQIGQQVRSIADT